MSDQTSTKTNDDDKPEEYKEPDKKPRKEKHSLQCGGAIYDIYTHYKLVRAVGQGAYGIVCSATNTKTNANVAIKKISNLFNDLVDAKRVLREIKLLSTPIPTHP